MDKSPYSIRYPQRNQEIYRLVTQEKVRFAVIARQYGISSQRVAKIYEAMKKKMQKGGEKVSKG